MIRLGVAVLLVALAAVEGANAQAQRPRPPAAQPAPAAPPPPPPEAPPPVYEPQLLRLSEILGALTYLSELCRPDGPRLNPQAEGEAWRAKMTELLDAEATNPAQRERLAGAYNSGLVGYRTTYRTCTASGQAALQRLLGEGAKLAQDLANRFGS